jgi:phosphoribosylanthranilate isomerase
MAGFLRGDGKPLVKICGLRRVEDLLAARDAGADLVGVVFAPSARQVSLDVARTLLIAVPRLPPVVGVFVNAQVAEMNRAAALCRLAYIQLAGDEDVDLGEQLDVPYLKVIHLADDATVDAALHIMSLHPSATAFILDSASPQGGGSGQPVDWSLAAEIVGRTDRPVLLAGGLTPHNVATALSITEAQGADVSSGVERNGWKDAELVRRFVQAVRTPRADLRSEASAPSV